MLLLFLYQSVIRLSSVNDLTEDYANIVSYATDVLELYTVPDFEIIENDFLVNLRTHDWLLSRTETLAKLCKERECNLLIILDMLENRSYENFKLLEDVKDLDHSKMTIDELISHLECHIETLSSIENKFDEKYGNKDILLIKKKETSENYVWIISSLKENTKGSNLKEKIEKNNVCCDIQALDKYIKELCLLGEYANLLSIKTIRNNLDYIKSDKSLFKDLVLHVE